MDDLVAFLNARLAEDEAAAARARRPRGLREVKAKREILAAHAVDYTGQYGEAIPGECLTCITNRDPYPESWQGDPWPCKTLRHLIAVYSDHPDYASLAAR